MKACSRCGAYIPDDARFCPSCGGGREAGAAGAPAPEAPGAPPPGGPPEPPPFDRARTAARVRVLGTLYMVMGVLLLLGVAFSFWWSATGRVFEGLEEFKSQGDPRFREQFERMTELITEPWYLALSHVVPFGLAVFYIWSGSRLRDLRGRTPALVAASLMMALSCCQGQCCCCLLTIPLGLYAIFVLTRMDVEMLLAEEAGA